MTKAMGEDLIMGEAYQIYLQETRRHLEETGSLFEKARPLSPEEIYNASARFHTIRGGAGFFGLNQIAEVAGKLERMLGRPEFNVARELPTIQELLKELKKFAQEIGVDS